MVTYILEKKFLYAAIACVAYSFPPGAKDPVTSTSPT
jgi:hypothetical protein